MESLEQIYGYFQQSGRRYADHYLAYANAHINELLVLDEERENILLSLRLAHGEPSLWPASIEATVGIHDYMVRQGHWEVWEEILRVAVSRARKLKAYKDELDLLTKLGGLLIDKGLYEEAENRLTEAQGLFSRIASIGIEVTARARRHMATLMLHKGQAEHALELLREALDSLTDREVLTRGNLLLHQSQLHYVMGSNRFALDALQETEQIYLAASGHGHYLAGVWNLSGLIYRSMGEYDKAVSYFLKALETYQDTGDRSAWATVSSNLGFTLWTMGELHDARQHLHLCLEIAQKIGHQRMIAVSYGNLGLVYMDLGDFEASFACLDKSIHICQEIGAEREYGRAIGNLGLLYYHMGDHEQALQCLDSDRHILVSSGIRASETLAYNSAYRGLAYNAMGDKGKASAQIQEALEISRRVGSRTVEILALRGMARIAPNESKAYLDQSLMLAIDLGKKLDVGICKLELGLLVDQLDEKQRKRLLVEAKRILERLDARSWLEQAQIALRALPRTEPSSQIAAP